MLSFDVIGETTVTGPTGDDYPAPTVTDVKRHKGVAGQFSVSAVVTYSGEAPHRVDFVGSTYGGPVIGVFGGGPQTFIRNPERFGDFGSDPIEWVRRYFA